VIGSQVRGAWNTGAARVMTLVLAAALFAGYGCYRTARGDTPVPVRPVAGGISDVEPSPAGDGGVPKALQASAGIPPPAPAEDTDGTSTVGNGAASETGLPDEEDALSPEPKPGAEGSGVSAATGEEAARSPRPAQGLTGAEPRERVSPSEVRKGAALRTAPPADLKATGRPHPGVPAPAWARGEEELVYRIKFLGVTAGYARFSYIGRVSLDGRDTYHIHIRAWTTSLLSLIYPLNDTMDYYLDAETLVPVQREYLKREGKNLGYDLTTYDQEKGLIVTRDKATGEVRKTVSIVPNVHDPVTAVYHYRANGRWGNDPCCNVYAGRKVWQISARMLGVERIESNGGKVETILVQPVIFHDGKIADKGDLRLWMTNDSRHVPVRIYAKIKFGTLVGELLPNGEGR
jgi:hypothetical protein